jgi:hypothetical protein
MEAGSDLPTEESEQNIDLAAFEGPSDMATDAHKRPVDGFHRFAGMISRAKGLSGVSGRLVELAGQLAGDQFFDSGRRHGHGLAVDTHQSFDAIHGTKLMRALAFRIEAHEHIAWQERTGHDVAAVLSDDRPDFQRAIGDQAFAFDGGTRPSLSGQIGDGDKP